MADLAAVLFDMDGTLTDSEIVWDVALAETAEFLGGTLSDETRMALIGTSLWVSVARLHADLGVPDADPEVTAEYLMDRAHEKFAGPLPWRPGAQELLAAVRAAGVRTALVTSTERRLVTLALHTIGADRFDVIVCGDEVTHPKPDPEPYRTAAELLGVAAADCVAVEDSPTGVTAAEGAGCAVLAVPSVLPIGPGPRRQVRDTLENVTLADLAALVAQPAS